MGVLQMLIFVGLSIFSKTEDYKKLLSKHGDHGGSVELTCIDLFFLQILVQGAF